MTVRELYEWAKKEKCLDSEIYYRTTIGMRNCPVSEPMVVEYFGKKETKTVVEFMSSYKRE